VTISQCTAIEKTEAEQVEKEAASGAKPSPVEDETESGPLEIESDGVESSLIGSMMSCFPSTPTWTPPGNNGELQCI
jgi:hypothetical protein